MGILRALFAISVVVGHSCGYCVFVGGTNAVRLFYMISGFLISYILVEKKSYANVDSFYISRYLRLYPTYFVVAILTLLIYIIDGNSIFFKIFHDSPVAANLLLMFSNATLFLQDMVMFMGVKNHHLLFTDYAKSEIVLWQALLVPQAWSLGVELNFYLVAPFILSRKRVLLVLLAFSVVLRFYLLYIGLGRQDPWTYRFFPAELSLFLFGALSHQIFLPMYRRVLSQKKYVENIYNIAIYAFIAIVLVYSFIPIKGLIKTIIIFPIFMLIMPLAFIFQSERKWDKLVGNLSYPVYICHILIIHIVTKIGITNRALFAVIVVIFSVCFSLALNAYIENPIESLRKKYKVRI